MIKYLEKMEKCKSKELYEECFLQDTTEYINYYYKERIPYNYVVAYMQNEKIVGEVHLIPKSVIIDNFKTNIMYIYGVCTEPEKRKQGIMTKILTKITEDLYQDMEPFTYLIPADENTAKAYRKLGFEYVMDKPNLRSLDQRRKPTHTLISRKADDSDLVRISIFAQSSMEKHYKVSIVKDVEYFKQIKELIEIQGGYIEVFIEDKVIIGYRIWLEDEVLEEVIDDSIQNLSWLDNTGKPYVMARLINIRKTLRLLGFKGVGCTVIKITDSLLKENNGCFNLTYHHGNVKLEKIDENSAKIDFRLTIGEFVAHIFGYNIIEGLPMVCPKNSFYINDYV